MEVVGNCPLCGSPIYGVRFTANANPPMWRSCSCAEQIINPALSALSAVSWPVTIRYLLMLLTAAVKSANLDATNPDDPARN